MSIHRERATLLLGQDRYALAEEQLRLALAETPSDAIAQALLALCVLKREDYKEATQLARTAVHLGPDIAYTHYIQALVLYERRRYKEALAPLAEAQRLDPTAAEFHGLHAAIEYHLDRWQGALEAAERGLACDPHHEQCASLRSMSLVQLGKFDQAAAATGAALHQSPDSAITHATRGWTLLTQGYHKEALEHFREALRLDPTSDSARAGMVHAMKARYWPYRLLLNYYYHMGRMTKALRWVFVIGLVVGVRIVRSAAESIPGLAPLGVLLGVAYALVVYFTWTGIPLSNVFLRFNRYGRYALSRDETVASNWVAAFLVGAVLSGLAALACWSIGFLILTGVCLALVLVVSMVYLTATGIRRWLMGSVAFALAIVGLGAAAAELTAEFAAISPQAAEGFEKIAIVLATLGGFGVLGFTWVANVSASTEERR
ncbi:MAG: tetratricopeptide repeat protein [Pirellulales bacterium]|nr:tetratricopeptide repeat protein [Pirellulales bacterium]